MRKAYMIGDGLGNLTVSEVEGHEVIRLILRSEDAETSIELKYEEAEQLKQILPGYASSYGNSSLRCDMPKTEPELKVVDENV